MTAKVRMTRSAKVALAKFVVFAAIALVLLALLYNTMVNSLPGGTHRYTAEFTNVSGLAVGDDVRVAGVRVGKVDDISIVPGGAEVTFEVKDGQPLLSNTRMVMRYQNLLGQRYLSLVQPRRHGSVLPPGSTLPRSRTSPGFDLTELLNGFRPLLETLRPADVNKLATEVVQVLQGQGSTVRGLLQETTRLTNFVADRDEVIGQVLTNLTPVLQEMAGQGSALRSTVRELRRLMTGLARDRHSIGASITGLSTLMDSTSRLLQQARRPATLDVHLFRQVSETLDRNKVLLAKALRAFGVAFDDLGRASSYRSAANVYICTMWLAVGGGEINLNAKPSGGPWSEVCR